MKIKEAYCSFEVSKLMKEKGFDEPCIGFYNPIDGCFFEASIRKSWDYNRHGSINAPTHQMALKWLREVKHIYIEIRLLFNQFTGEPSYKAMVWDLEDEVGKPLPDDVEYMFYETCVEAALKYCLTDLCARLPYKVKIWKIHTHKHN